MVAVTCLTTLINNKNLPRVSNKHQLITQFLEMLARENEKQAQDKMLERFEQSLEHLNEAEITSIEVLQSVVKEIQAIGNDCDNSISSNKEPSSESDSSESSGNDSEVHDSEVGDAHTPISSRKPEPTKK